LLELAEETAASLSAAPEQLLDIVDSGAVRVSQHGLLRVQDSLADTTSTPPGR
jgi:hypothetical protein